MNKIIINGRKWQLNVVRNKLDDKGIMSRFPRKGRGFSDDTLIAYITDSDDMVMLGAICSSNSVGECIVSGVDYQQRDNKDYVVFNENLIPLLEAAYKRLKIRIDNPIKKQKQGCYFVNATVMHEAGYGYR